MITIAFDNLMNANASYYSNFFNKSPAKLTPGKLIIYKIDYNYNNFSNYFSTGIHGFGNSIDPINPWGKVNHGKSRFKNIVEQNQSIQTKEKLVEDLFEMLTDKTVYVKLE